MVTVREVLEQLDLPNLKKSPKRLGIQVSKCITGFLMKQGLSIETRRPYIDALVSKETLYLEPAFDSSKLIGAVPFLVVAGLDEAGRSRVEADHREHLNENVLLIESHFENAVVSACWADEFDDVRLCCDKILKVKGFQNPWCFPHSSRR